jgi:hypothetical protein
MTLTPKLPPGRANRKALAFAAEISRLRAAGYSFDAIRGALLEVGVTVSQTTVKREVAKAAGVAVLTELSNGKAPCNVAPRSQAAQTSKQSEPYPLLKFGTAEVPPLSRPGASRRGEDIADKFMEGRVTNSLFKEGTRNESRCD